MSTRLGFRASADLKGLIRDLSKDRPLLKLVQGVAGKMCPSVGVFDLLRDSFVQLVIDNDISKMSVFVNDEEKEIGFLHGDGHNVLTPLCPFGRARFEPISCSRSLIRWKLTLPHRLGTLYGSVELTSDATSLLTYEAGPGREHVVSVKLHRSPAHITATGNPSQAKLSPRLSYRPCCGTVPEDSTSTAVCRLFRT